jgi:hypothetical protein
MISLLKQGKIILDVVLKEVWKYEIDFKILAYFLLYSNLKL